MHTDTGVVANDPTKLLAFFQPEPFEYSSSRLIAAERDNKNFQTILDDWITSRILSAGKTERKTIVEKG